MAQQERFLLALQHFDKALARLHEVLAEPPRPPSCAMR